MSATREETVKAQSVSELVKVFIFNLKHNFFPREYTPETALQHNGELSLLTSVVVINTGGVVTYCGEQVLTVQQFAQLMWDRYYAK